MIARELEIGTECRRCRGTGSVSPIKGQRTVPGTVICSCYAGRSIAAHIGMVRNSGDSTRLYNG